MMGVHKVDKDKFYEAYNGWASGELSLRKATKVAGMSLPTLKKYFYMLIKGEEFPDTLFGDKKDE